MQKTSHRERCNDEYSDFGNYIRRQAEDMSSRVYFPFAMLTPDMWSLQKENLCGAWKHLWERFDRKFPYKESVFLYKCFQYTEKETRKLVTIIMQVLPKGKEKDTEMIVVLRYIENHQHLS